MNELDIRQEAFTLRRHFGFSEIEPIQFRKLFLKEKVLTYHTPLDDNFSGMAIKAGDKRFILVNSNHPVGRQHFTICHELYHLYVDKNFFPHRCQTALFDKRNKSEYYADSFASHFLLPEQGLLSMIPKAEWGKNKISLATIIKIEQYYECSRSALANRLLFWKKISIEYRDVLCEGVRKSARDHGYLLDLYEDGNEGELWGDYGILAKGLFDNEKISEGHFASIMSDIDIDIFESLDDNGD